MAELKNIEEIRGRDTRELRLELQEHRKELFQLHFHGAAEAVAKSARFRQIRRTVARILTVLGERERAGGVTTATATVEAPAGKPAKAVKAGATAAEPPAKAPKQPKAKEAKATKEPKSAKATPASKSSAEQAGSGKRSGKS